MKNPFVVLTTLLILSLAAAGCAVPAGTDSDVEGIRAFEDAMRAAQTAGDMDASMALLTDDAVGMQPDGTILEGEDAWRAYWKNFYSGDSLEPALSDEEIQAGGDWGFISGTWTVSAAAAEGAEPKRTSVHFISILHREADGSWKQARVMWHPAQPATAEE